MDAPPIVLVVDDDSGLVRLMEKALRREGCAPISALSGATAVAQMTRHEVDLLLLD